MKWRFGRWLVLAWCMIAAPLGCSRTQRNDLMAANPAGAKKPDELPPKEAAQVCLTLAQAMEQKGHDADAIMQYERARHNDPRLAPAITRRLAVLYDHQGNYGKAIEEFEKARKAAPKDADLLNDLGYCHYNQGEFALAEKTFRQALTLDAKHPKAWINLGMALGQQGRYAESLDSFGKVVSRAEAHSNLAFILTSQRNREQAKEEYRRALDLDPSLRVARAMLAKLETAGQEAIAKEAAAADKGWSSATIDFGPPSTGPVRIGEPRLPHGSGS